VIYSGKRGRTPKGGQKISDHQDYCCGGVAEKQREGLKDVLGFHGGRYLQKIGVKEEEVKKNEF